ncbi:MAG: cytochrome c [Rhodocyclales bacterium GT-UBC]|nr:MAG: cytochrome c [Rhodocyclales bacterium GT-UBC]
MPRPHLLLALLLPIVLAGCGEPEDTRPGQPVAHRRAAFNKILKAFEPMGVQLRDGHYDADKFVTQSRQLADLADSPWPYFAADTHYPPTRAKAAVWSEAERFEKARQDFLHATKALVAAADSRNAEQVKQAYDAVHGSCRNCHKAFKD